MIATLTFNLPEESVEHQTAIDGQLWRHLVWELDQTLRNAIKYGHAFAEFDTEDNKGLIFTRQALNDLLAVNNLSLD
jgi:hypothetical protein